MKIATMTGLMLMFQAVALTADKPDFSGTWRAEGAADQAVITIQQDGTELNMNSAGDSDLKTAVTCNTMGKQCEAKVSGDAVKVSYWFNGPALIEMSVQGKNGQRVTETRRQLSDDGRKMTVEVIQIAPAGKDAQKFVFIRDEQIASGASQAQ